MIQISRIKNLLDKYREDYPEQVEYAEKKLNEVAKNWDRTIKDENGEEQDLTLLLVFEYALGTERITNGKIQIEQMIDKLLGKCDKFRLGRLNKEYDEDVITSKTYDDIDAVQAISDRYEQENRIDGNLGAHTFDYINKNGKHEQAVAIYREEEKEIYNENGEKKNVILSGSKFDDLSDLRQTLFHEWNHIMQKVEVKEDFPPYYTSTDGKTYINYEEENFYRIFEKNEKGEYEISKLKEIIGGLKLSSGLVTYEKIKDEKTGKYEVLYHNQIEEGIVELIARRQMLALGIDEKEIDTSKYPKQVKIMEILSAERDRIKCRDGVTFADFLTNSTIIKQELEQQQIKGKDKLHFFGDYIDDDYSINSKVKYLVGNIPRFSDAIKDMEKEPETEEEIMRLAQKLGIEIEEVEQDNPIQKLEELVKEKTHNRSGKEEEDLDNKILKNLILSLKKLSKEREEVEGVLEEISSENSRLNIDMHLDEFKSYMGDIVEEYNGRLEKLQYENSNSVIAYNMLINYRKIKNNMELNGSFRADLGKQKSQEEIEENKKECLVKLDKIISSAKKVFGNQISEKNIEEHLLEISKDVFELINDCKKDIKAGAEKTDLTISSCIYKSPEELTDGKLQKSKKVLNVEGELGDFIFAQADNLVTNSYLLRKSGKGGVYQKGELCIPGNPNLLKAENGRLLLNDPAYAYLMKTDDFEPVVSVGNLYDGKAVIKFDGEWTSDKDGIDRKDMYVKEVRDVTEMLDYLQIFLVPDGKIIEEIDKCSTMEEKIDRLINTNGVQYMNQKCGVNTKIKSSYRKYEKPDIKTYSFGEFEELYGKNKLEEIKNALTEMKNSKNKADSNIERDL